MHLLKGLTLLTVAAVCVCAGAADSESGSWHRYGRAEAGFSIEFPARPKVTAKMRNFFGKKLLETQAMYDQPKTFGMFVKDSNLAGAKIAGRERQFLDTAVKSLRFEGATVTKPVSFTWQGVPGSYMKIVKNKMEVRMYALVHKGHYLEFCICGMEGKVDMKAGKRFIDSLKLF